MKVGDRVCVHVEGKIIVDEWDPSGMTIGVDETAWHASNKEPRYKVKLDPVNEEWAKRNLKREQWFSTNELEQLADKPLVKDNGWRDVCADMIRDGRNDLEVVKMFMSKAPAFYEYVQALEEFARCFELSIPETNIEPSVGGGLSIAKSRRVYQEAPNAETVDALTKVQASAIFEGAQLVKLED